MTRLLRRINRTIVGLKYNAYIVYDNQSLGINRTIVGLKYCNTLGGLVRKPSINRTIVGLKSGLTLTTDARHDTVLIEPLWD